MWFKLWPLKIKYIRSLGKVIYFRELILHIISSACMAWVCGKALGMYLEGSNSKDLKGFGFKRPA